jgi:O-antigen/teichoic acid export membrane protein
MAGPVPRETAARARKAATSVLDQGLASLAPFAVSILLARSAPPAELGSFSLAYAVLLFAMALHQGYVIEPMLMRREQGRDPEILAFVHAASLAPVLAVAVVAAPLAGLVSGVGAGLTLVAGLAFAALATFAATRRAFYGQGKPERAVLSSLAYLALAGGGMWAATRLGAVDATLALAILGLAASLASLPAVLGLARRAPRQTRGELAGLWALHRSAGGWLSAAALLSWLPVNSQFIVLSWTHGLEASAQLRAAYNLVLPAQLAIANFSFLLVPALVRRSADPARFRRMVLQALAFVAGTAAAYWALLAVGGGFLLDLVYGGRYPGLAGPLRALAALPVLTGAHVVLSSGLKALHDARGNLAAFALGSLLMPFAVAASWRFGLSGAVGGMLAVYLAVDALAARRLRAARTPHA